MERASGLLANQDGSGSGVIEIPAGGVRFQFQG